MCINTYLRSNYFFMLQPSQKAFIKRFLFLWQYMYAGVVSKYQTCSFEQTSLKCQICMGITHWAKPCHPYNFSSQFPKYWSSPLNVIMILILILSNYPFPNGWYSLCRCYWGLTAMSWPGTLLSASTGFCKQSCFCWNIIYSKTNILT